MCLAIYKPKGKQIKKQYLLNGYEGNGDGCGFCYAHGGSLHVERGFKSFEDLWKAFASLQRKHAMLVHFRFATHGDKTVTNMHPFVIADGQYAVIHNGVLNIKPEKQESDTSAFATRVMAPLFERFEFNASLVHYLIETSIGDANKIVAMRFDGKVAIYNESRGHWHKGIWYSNRGYSEVTRRWDLSTCTYPTAWNSMTSNWSKRPASVFDEQEAQAELQAVLATDGGIADAESSNALTIPAHEGSRYISISEYYRRLEGKAEAFTHESTRER